MSVLLLVPDSRSMCLFSYGLPTFKKLRQFFNYIKNIEPLLDFSYRGGNIRVPQCDHMYHIGLININPFIISIDNTIFLWTVQKKFFLKTKSRSSGYYISISRSNIPAYVKTLDTFLYKQRHKEWNLANRQTFKIFWTMIFDQKVALLECICPFMSSINSASV